jgi:hypothetical protein
MSRHVQTIVPVMVTVRLENVFAKLAGALRTAASPLALTSFPIATGMVHAMPVFASELFSRFFIFFFSLVLYKC